MNKSAWLSFALLSLLLLPARAQSQFTQVSCKGDSCVFVARSGDSTVVVFDNEIRVRFIRALTNGGSIVFPDDVEFQGTVTGISGGGSETDPDFRADHRDSTRAHLIALPAEATPAAGDTIFIQKAGVLKAADIATLPGGAGADDQTAAEVPFTPAGGIAAANVQLALEEVDAEHTVDTKLTTEEVQDEVGGMVSGNTETGAAVTYDDTNGKLNFVAEVTQAELDSHTGNAGAHHAKTTSGDEITSGTVADARVAATITRDSEVPSLETDPDFRADHRDSTRAHLIDLPAEATPAAGDTIFIQKAGVLKAADIATLPGGAGADDQTAAEVPFTPAGGIAAANVQLALEEVDAEHTVDTKLTTEEVQDEVGGMVTGNTETGVAVDYDDTNGKLNFVVEVTQAELDSHTGNAGAHHSLLDSKSFIITDPTANSDYPLWKVHSGITISTINVLVEGGTNVVGGLDEADASGNTPVAIDADITGTAGSNVADDGTLANPTLDSGDYLLWHTTSVTGAPTSITVTFTFMVTP